MPRSTPSIEIEFQVEFYDVDSMQVVWHGHYLKYFEKARCALLNALGYGYLEMRDSGYAFPVIGVSLKYIQPLTFGEKVRARAWLEEYENCLIISYALYNAAGKMTTRGSSTQMAYDLSGNESCMVCPDILLEKVQAFMDGRSGESA
ncbi:MAG: acyl-CoA thioesterase [Desulfovibrionaceae bacterium]|nr:acyl-CoA thioesterase [Desulfovibrionaceae bacterium]